MGLVTPRQEASHATVPWGLPQPGQLSWQINLVRDVMPVSRRKHKGFVFHFHECLLQLYLSNHCSFEEATCVLKRANSCLLPCLAKAGPKIGEMEPSQPSAGSYG